MFVRSCLSLNAHQEVCNTFAQKNPENAYGVLLERINDLNIRECKALMHLFAGHHVNDSLHHKASFALRHRMLNKLEQKADLVDSPQKRLAMLMHLQRYMPPRFGAYEPAIFEGIKFNIFNKLGISTDFSCPCRRFYSLVDQAQRECDAVNFPSQQVFG